MNLDHIAALLAEIAARVPDGVWAAASAATTLFLLWQAKRAITSAATPAADILTYVAAAIATGVSAQGMWHFFEVVFPDLPIPLRVTLFAFIEIGMLASAVRARRNMRESAARAKTDPLVRPSAGIDGTAVWALTGLTAVLSSLEAASPPEFIFRLAAPLVAAWLWERGMAIERQRITGRSRINWRLTPERVMVRLGLAEANDRTASEVDAHRRLTRVALAAKKAKALRDSGATPKKVTHALARLDKAMNQAVEHTGLSNDESRQQALLAQIDSLNSTGVLAQRTKVAAWADPVSGEKRANALAAIDDSTRFDTAEATQRALDKAALTLMALTQNVTSDVTSQRLNNEINKPLNGRPVPAPREAAKLSPSVTSNVTPALTVERVNNALNFDVTNPDVYAVEKALSANPYVTPVLSGQLSGAALNVEVNEDPEDASKTQVMRDFWDSEVAEDRYPTVTELADHAGVHPSHASRKRKEWVAELQWWKRRKAEPKRTSRVTDPATSAPTGGQS